jgi:UDP-glucuronate 4-epimerase
MIITMKYLITGSAGFIGFHLANSILKNKNNQVFGIDNLNNYYSISLKKKRTRILKKNKNFFFKKIDLTRFSILKNYITRIKPDYIFHLAGQPGVVYSFKNPMSYKKNNVEATENIIRILPYIKIKKFIFSSSSSVYGDQKTFPIKETVKLRPKNYYALTKLKCEKIITNKLKENNIPYFIFRFFTVYGSLGRPDMFIYSTISKLKKNEKIILYNKGDYLRDFTYVDDVINILRKSIYKQVTSSPIINICGSRPLKVTKVLNIIGKNIGKKVSIVFKPKRKGEMQKTHGSNLYLKKIFKLKNFINFNIGIKKLIIEEKKYFNI